MNKHNPFECVDVACASCAGLPVLKDLGFLVSMPEVDEVEALSVELTVRAILADAIKRIELETSYAAHVTSF